MEKELEDKIRQEIYCCYGIPPELFEEESPLKNSIEAQAKCFEENCMNVKLKL